ncbi:SLAP domain-containing protein [Lactobacillus sp. ESL0681]|uniref:SLAP domain-containing protein n=1 Tax=Lactobacillus sp. ESL0681 TaxID=2983211 RepID=UPI0023F9F450|nr:SLAP domain-containing protein [Lactobacillus sp. ESL0681]WEV40905.1 SLAP domain-containing protein [Lactobacillus sp. ESL0681]
MIRKNKSRKQPLSVTKKKQSFAIRKLTIGAASVCLGSYFITTQITATQVKADTVSETQQVTDSKSKQPNLATFQGLSEFVKADTDNNSKSTTRANEHQEHPEITQEQQPVESSQDINSSPNAQSSKTVVTSNTVSNKPALLTQVQSAFTDVEEVVTASDYADRIDLKTQEKVADWYNFAADNLRGVLNDPDQYTETDIQKLLEQDGDIREYAKWLKAEYNAPSQLAVDNWSDFLLGIAAPRVKTIDLLCDLYSPTELASDTEVRITFLNDKVVNGHGHSLIMQQCYYFSNDYLVPDVTVTFEQMRVVNAINDLAAREYAIFNFDADGYNSESGKAIYPTLKLDQVTLQGDFNVNSVGMLALNSVKIDHSLNRLKGQRQLIITGDNYFDYFFDYNKQDIWSLENNPLISGGEEGVSIAKQFYCMLLAEDARLTATFNAINMPEDLDYRQGFDFIGGGFIVGKNAQLTLSGDYIAKLLPRYDQGVFVVGDSAKVDIQAGEHCGNVLATSPIEARQDSTFVAELNSIHCDEYPDSPTLWSLHPMNPKLFKITSKSTITFASSDGLYIHGEKIALSGDHQHNWLISKPRAATNPDGTLVDEAMDDRINATTSLAFNQTDFSELSASQQADYLNGFGNPMVLNQDPLAEIKQFLPASDIAIQGKAYTKDGQVDLNGGYLPFGNAESLSWGETDANGNHLPGFSEWQNPDHKIYNLRLGMDYQQILEQTDAGNYDVQAAAEVAADAKNINLSQVIWQIKDKKSTKNVSLTELMNTKDSFSPDQNVVVSINFLPGKSMNAAGEVEDHGLVGENGQLLKSAQMNPTDLGNAVIKVVYGDGSFDLVPILIKQAASNQPSDTSQSGANITDSVDNGNVPNQVGEASTPVAGNDHETSTPTETGNVDNSKPGNIDQVNPDQGNISTGSENNQISIVDENHTTEIENQPQDNLNLDQNPSASAGEVEASTRKQLHHNAYLYNKQGKRVTNLVLKSGSWVTVYGVAVINQRKFYRLEQDLYLAAGNIDAQVRKLNHNAYVYDQTGARVTSECKLKGSELKTYGDPVKIKGQDYLIIGDNRLVKSSNIANAPIAPERAKVTGLVLNGELKHNAYVYDAQGKRTNQVILAIGSQMYAAIEETINGRKYYDFGNNQRLLAANIDGKPRSLTHNAYIYNRYGQRIGKKVLKKQQRIQTYGSPIKIKQQSYYAIGDNQYLRCSNFK